MSERGKPSRRTNGDAPKRRLTQAETIKRQQAIVQARDLEYLPWAAIAEKLKLGEKEARETYRRYISEIVPFLIAVPAGEKAAELLRDLEEIRQQQFQIALAGDSDSAKVGALRDAAKTVQMEFEIRHNLGLMPKLVGDAELQSLARQLAEALDRHSVPREAVDEIERIFNGHLGEG